MKTFHLVRIPDVPDWLLCGWIAWPSLDGTGHGEWSALCEWLCDCPVPKVADNDRLQNRNASQVNERSR